MRLEGFLDVISTFLIKHVHLEAARLLLYLHGWTHSFAAIAPSPQLVGNHSRYASIHRGGQTKINGSDTRTVPMGKRTTVVTWDAPRCALDHPPFALYDALSIEFTTLLNLIIGIHLM